MNVYPTGSSDDNIDHLSVYIHFSCRAQQQQDIEQAINDELNEDMNCTNDNGEDDSDEEQGSQGVLNENIRQRRRYSKASVLLRMFKYITQIHL